MTDEQLVKHAKERWNEARRCFDADRPEFGWVNLLAMGMCMAAAQRKLLADDLVKIAHAGGLIP
jgi:hypothetical protein